MADAKHAVLQALAVDPRLDLHACCVGSSSFSEVDDWVIQLLRNRYIYVTEAKSVTEATVMVRDTEAKVMVFVTEATVSSTALHNGPLLPSRTMTLGSVANHDLWFRHEPI